MGKLIVLAIIPLLMAAPANRQVFPLKLKAGHTITHVETNGSEYAFLAWSPAEVKKKGGKKKQDSKREYYVVTAKNTYGPFEEVQDLSYTGYSGKLEFTAREGSGTYLYHDGNRFGPFDEVMSLPYSPDGSTPVYRAGARRQRYLHSGADTYMDTQVESIYTNGTDLVFSTRVKDGYLIYAGKRKYGPYSYDTLGELMISQDGTTIMYHATRNDRHYISVGGMVTGPYDGMGCLMTGPDGKTAVFSEYTGGKWHIHIGDRTYGPYDQVGCVESGNTYGRLLYSARTGDEWSIYHEERVIHRTTGADSVIESLALSPDGNTTAFVIDTGSPDGGCYVHAGRERFGPYTTASGPVFSRDGKTLYYIAGTAESKYLYAGKQRFGPYSNAESLDYDPEIDTVTFISSQDNEDCYQILLNGKVRTGSSNGRNIVYLDGNNIVIEGR